VGHLALMDDRSWDILEQLGVVQKLLKLLEHPFEAVIASAVYSLTHIVVRRSQNLRFDLIYFMVLKFRYWVS
jgi:hypothetical protein